MTPKDQDLNKISFAHQTWDSGDSSHARWANTLLGSVVEATEEAP